MIIIENTKSNIRIQDEKFFSEVLKPLNTVSEKKNRLQERALELSDSHAHVVLSWATGCGKSLAALKIIKSRIDAGDKTPWFIVCSELNHIDNWIAEIVKHKLSYLMEHIEIFCYASLGKYKNRKANLILDESHSVSDLRLEHLKTIQTKDIISLSATLNKERKQQLSQLGTFREFEVTMTDAINIGILPAPTIYVIHDELNNDSSKPYEIYIKKKGHQIVVDKDKSSVYIPKLETTYDNYFNVLKANKDLNKYELHVSCTQKQYYDLISNDIEYYKNAYNSTRTDWNKNKMLRLGNDRKTYISNKKETILFDINNMLSLNEFRFITFTGSIEQCDLFGYSRAIHSKVPEKKRKEIINNFNSKKINSIYAVQMLREGQNFEDIEAGIITQLDSESLSFIQMMGRVFRSTNPVLFVLVKNNTQDVTYLKKCIDGLDEKYITYVEYNQKNMETLNNILCQRKQKG